MVVPKFDQDGLVENLDIRYPKGKQNFRLVRLVLLHNKTSCHGFWGVA